MTKPESISIEAHSKKSIKAISDLEHEALARRTAAEAFSDFVVSQGGRPSVIAVHAVWFVVWILWNTGHVLGLHPFDPYPFMGLSTIVSLEAIFLSLFILVSQNRATRRADERAHLDLQINLLAEREATQMLRLLQERIWKGAKCFAKRNRQLLRGSWKNNLLPIQTGFETITPARTLTSERSVRRIATQFPFWRQTKMKIQGVIWAIALGAASLVAQNTDSNGVKPDNTKVNQRDRDTNQPTADQQKNNATDLDLTKNIRRSIIEDKSLSSDVQNVKVISQNGTVTLKGPVKSEAEKSAIVSKAVSVAGSADKVVDQMSVKQ
jgi:uncharacterized membrane protein